ncbi:MAG: hypothetical protein PHT32_09320, partial [Candidatus Omnitrophica bacterium]|nr:hypothetical protein [Candidatus Omnitrophota bacterium]
QLYNTEHGGIRRALSTSRVKVNGKMMSLPDVLLENLSDSNSLLFRYAYWCIATLIRFGDDNIRKKIASARISKGRRETSLSYIVAGLLSGEDRHSRYLGYKFTALIMYGPDPLFARSVLTTPVNIDGKKLSVLDVLLENCASPDLDGDMKARGMLTAMAIKSDDAMINEIAESQVNAAIRGIDIDPVTELWVANAEKGEPEFLIDSSLSVLSDLAGKENPLVNRSLAGRAERIIRLMENSASSEYMLAAGVLGQVARAGDEESTDVICRARIRSGGGTYDIADVLIEGLVRMDGTLSHSSAVNLISFIMSNNGEAVNLLKEKAPEILRVAALSDNAESVSNALMVLGAMISGHRLLRAAVIKGRVNIPGSEPFAISEILLSRIASGNSSVSSMANLVYSTLVLYEDEGWDEGPSPAVIEPVRRSLGRIGIPYSSFFHAPFLEELFKVGIPFAFKYFFCLSGGMTGSFSLVLGVFALTFIILHVFNRAPPDTEGLSFTRKLLSWSKWTFEVLFAPILSALIGWIASIYVPDLLINLSDKYIGQGQTLPAILSTFAATGGAITILNMILHGGLVNTLIVPLLRKLGIRAEYGTISGKTKTDTLSIGERYNALDIPYSSGDSAIGLDKYIKGYFPEGMLEDIARGDRFEIHVGINKSALMEIERRIASGEYTEAKEIFRFDAASEKGRDKLKAGEDYENIREHFYVARTRDGKQVYVIGGDHHGTRLTERLATLKIKGIPLSAINVIDHKTDYKALYREVLSGRTEGLTRCVITFKPRKVAAAMKKLNDGITYEKIGKEGFNCYLVSMPDGQKTLLVALDDAYGDQITDMLGYLTAETPIRDLLFIGLAGYIDKTSAVPADNVPEQAMIGDMILYVG